MTIKDNQDFSFLKMLECRMERVRKEGKYELFNELEKEYSDKVKETIEGLRTLRETINGFTIRNQIDKQIQQLEFKFARGSYYSVDELTVVLNNKLDKFFNEEVQRKIKEIRNSPQRDEDAKLKLIGKVNKRSIKKAKVFELAKEGYFEVFDGFGNRVYFDSEDSSSISRKSGYFIKDRFVDEFIEFYQKSELEKFEVFKFAKNPEQEIENAKSYFEIVEEQGKKQIEDLKCNLKKHKEMLETSNNKNYRLEEENKKLREELEKLKKSDK